MMTHIDPVCGMQVNQQNAAGRSAHQGKTFYFCSDDAKHSSIRIRNLTCSGRCASRVVNTPKATGLRAGRLCAAPFNPLGALRTRNFALGKNRKKVSCETYWGPGPSQSLMAGASGAMPHFWYWPSTQYRRYPPRWVRRRPQSPGQRYRPCGGGR